MQPVNHFKIGLFVLLAVAATLATAVAFGASASQRQTLAYHTFFNESVQGLEVGSPVKYRGVTIGVVSAIEIAPDRRHVDVVAEIDVEDVRRLGLTEEDGNREGPVRFVVPADLRAQLQGQGITGVKFLAIDFFDPESNPPPALPFDTPVNYIPAAPSLMKNLEDSIVRAVDSLPVVAEKIAAAVTRVDGILARLEEKDVAGKALTTFDEVNQTLVSVRRVVEKIERAQVPERAAQTLEKVDVAVTRLDRVLQLAEGDQGLVASATRASDAFTEVGKSAHGTTRELDETLREVRDAAASIRDLAESLERDPDMLLKGRSPLEAR